jgi:hypothetical protein
MSGQRSSACARSPAASANRAAPYAIIAWSPRSPAPCHVPVPSAMIELGIGLYGVHESREMAEGVHRRFMRRPGAEEREERVRVPDRKSDPSLIAGPIPDRGY